jgi:hypothetical protein
MKYKVVIEAEVEYPNPQASDQSERTPEQVQQELDYYIRNRGFDRFEWYFAQGRFTVKVEPIENAAVR